MRNNGWLRNVLFFGSIMVGSGLQMHGCGASVGTEKNVEVVGQDASDVDKKVLETVGTDSSLPDAVKEIGSGESGNNNEVVTPDGGQKDMGGSDSKATPEERVTTPEQVAVEKGGREVLPEPLPETPVVDKGPAKPVVRVGPTRALKTPSQAASKVKDGDVVEIDAGVYSGDVAVWQRNNLTIRGVGGKAHLKANGKSAERKAIWVIKGNNTVVEDIEFSGAKVGDKNGAGIRQEGNDLIVRRCFFHDNENGILAGSKPQSTIIVEYSVFANNGAGDGLSHNMYINEVKHFVLRYSYTHHAKVGHNVKTRAIRSDILFNRITDEKDGTSSYNIDFSNGGLVHVIGNIVQQSPKTQNSTMIMYGAEGQKRPKNEFYFVNNTVVNQRSAGFFFQIKGGNPAKVRVYNNLFVGNGSMTTNALWDVKNNLTSKSDPGFVNAGTFDFHLKSTSAAANGGVDPGSAGSFKLLPNVQYKHTANKEPRKMVGKPDLGAFEAK